MVDKTTIIGFRNGYSVINRAPGAPLLINDLYAFSRSALGVKIAQAFCDRADFAVADYAIVDLYDGGEFTHRSRAKHLISAVNIDNCQIRFDAADFFGCANLHNRRASNSFRARHNATCRKIAITHDEHMGLLLSSPESSSAGSHDEFVRREPLAAAGAPLR